MDAEESLAPDALLLTTARESNSFAHIEYEHGDVEKAFAEADRVFTKRLHHGRFHAAPARRARDPGRAGTPARRS